MLCYKKNSGFTMVELMVVVGIIGLLAAIGYPSYVDSVRKGRRSDAQDALTDAMQKQAMYYANHAQYATSAADLTAAGIDTTSAEGYYNLTVVNIPATCTAPNCVSMSAVPTSLNNQNSDLISQYILTSTGYKQATYDSVDYPSWTNF